MSLRSKAKAISENLEQKQPESISTFEAIRTGFLTNAFNPKVTFFFLALFTQVINPSTPVIIKSVYGLEMILATMTWFSFVSIVLTNSIIKNKFLKVSHIVEKFTGGILIALGIKVLLET